MENVNGSVDKYLSVGFGRHDNLQYRHIEKPFLEKCGSLGNFWNSIYGSCYLMPRLKIDVYLGFSGLFVPLWWVYQKILIQRHTHKKNMNKKKNGRQGKKQ